MVKLNRLALNHLVKNEEIVLYPYRTASVKSALIEINAESEEERKNVQHLQEMLCEKVTKIYSPEKKGIHEIKKPVEPDNHTCFQVGDMVIMFNDWSVFIGTDIVIKNW